MIYVKLSKEFIVNAINKINWEMEEVFMCIYCLRL